MDIKIIPNEEASPPGKLADVELHFGAADGVLDGLTRPIGGVLNGLKLIGFSIWERRGARDVTFPARQYSVNGERRSFALLRPTGAVPDGQERIKQLILEAYAEHEAKTQG